MSFFKKNENNNEEIIINNCYSEASAVRDGKAIEIKNLRYVEDGSTKYIVELNIQLTIKTGGVYVGGKYG